MAASRRRGRLPCARSRQAGAQPSRRLVTSSCEPKRAQAACAAHRCMLGGRGWGGTMRASVLREKQRRKARGAGANAAPEAAPHRSAASDGSQRLHESSAGRHPKPRTRRSAVAAGWVLDRRGRSAALRREARRARSGGRCWGCSPPLAQGRLRRGGRARLPLNRFHQRDVAVPQERARPQEPHHVLRACARGSSRPDPAPAPRPAAPRRAPALTWPRVRPRQAAQLRTPGARRPQASRAWSPRSRHRQSASSECSPMRRAAASNRQA